MSDRPTLSVCVITYNEEEYIRPCLEAVKWADEIIVVDSLSTDRTREIAREYTRHVFEHTWHGHVEQKNNALERATMDWVLSVDADEQVSPKLAEEIRHIISDQTRREIGWTVPRKTFYLNKWIMHGGWYPSRRLRLIRRGHGQWRGVNPHDRLVADGPVGQLKGDLYHYTYRDIADHFKTVNNFTSISSRELYAHGKRHALLGMLLHPPAKFFKMFLLRLGFLDGMAGFILAVFASYYVFAKYAKLWELVRAERRRQ